MGRPCGAGAASLGRVAGRGSSSLLTGLVGGEMSGFGRPAQTGDSERQHLMSVFDLSDS